MALQYTPFMLGVMLVVAVGTLAYSLWNSNSNSHQNYSYGKSDDPFEYACGYDSRQMENENTGERKRKRRTPEQCTICLDALRTHVKSLPCQHAFHEKCITAWFHTNDTCPICRKRSNTNL